MNSGRLQQVLPSLNSDLFDSPFTPQFIAMDPSPFVKPQTSESAQAPEQKLTLLAVRLVVLEKIATALGKIAFIWATVVLIGGLGGDLLEIDFWVMTGLLMTEGARVFSRSQEVFLKHAASRLGSIWEATFLNSARSNAYSMRNVDVENGELNVCVSRKWSPEAVPVIPYAKLFSLSNFNIFLHLLEILSAVISIGLSLTRLIQQHFDGVPRRRNLSRAANLFYALILAEASIFLIERAYWSYKIYWENLLVQVTRKSNLTDDYIEVMKEFFYDVYSICLKGHPFDGLDIDLIEFSIRKMRSDNAREQQGGVTILSTFVTRKDRFAAEALRKIGSTPGAVERLLEMITWKEKQEREIRRAAAWIVTDLVKREKNYYFRIAAIPGAVEGIVSLLSDDGFNPNDSQDVAAANELKVLGLAMLTELATDPKHNIIIGSTKGLIPTLVSFIEEEDIGRAEDHNEFEIIRRSLALLRAIAETPAESGITLRNSIAETVFVLRNLADVLAHGDHHPVLQGHAIDVLTSLALDDSIRERIGSTGAIISHLRKLFLREVQEGTDQYIVALKAGKAINILALHSPKNCKRILGHKSYQDGTELKGIIRQLGLDAKRGTYAAQILRTLLPDCDETEQKEICKSFFIAIEWTLRHKGKRQEAGLGLAARMLPFVNKDDLNRAFLGDEDKEQVTEVTIRLISLAAPSIEASRIRRYAVEFACALSCKDSWFLKRFREKGIVTYLDKLCENVSDVENFHAFSGSMGLIRHTQTMSEVIDRALSCFITS